MATIKLKRITSIVLGLFLILYASNQFFHFLPMSYGKMPEFTREFLDAILVFLPALYVFEMLIGIVLIANKWVPFVAIVLAPLSISFLMFNFLNGGWNIIPAVIVALLNLMLLIAYRKKYYPLFE